MSLLHKYAEKPSSYFDYANLKVASKIQGCRLHVLDVGCGNGSLIRVLSGRGVIERSYGIELFPTAATAAAEIISEVWNASAEDFIPPLLAGTLDYVVCADVLEHLRDPAPLLARLRPLLKVGGRIIVSLPNASNRRLIWNLIVRNEWKYEPSGIMDATHLRWFTSNSAARLITEAGFAISEFEYVFWGRGGALVDRVSMGALSRFTAAQLLLVAAPV